MDESELRDKMQLWCDEHGLYELGRRFAFVPEEDLKKYILFQPIPKIEKWLDDNGY